MISMTRLMYGRTLQRSQQANIKVELKGALKEGMSDDIDTHTPLNAVSIRNCISTHPDKICRAIQSRYEAYVPSGVTYQTNLRVVHLTTG